MKIRKNLEEITMEFINEKIIPHLKKYDFDLNEEVLIIGASRTGFQEGYNLANKKFI